nr:hypothetical protein [Hyphomonas sp. Mor2]
MAPDYTLHIETRLDIGATPIALKTLSFATPKQTIACVLSETHTVLLFAAGETTPNARILVDIDPIDISGGGRDFAYIACQSPQTVDVIRRSGFVKRIPLPGIPQSLAWNGSYAATRQKILVACQIPDTEEGVVVVIDEETLSIANTLKVGKRPRGISLDGQRKHFLVANYGSDSITIIDQAGTKVLATLPTAGRPWMANVSWSDPQDIMVSLNGGGILQRLDGSQFPPVLSGLAALKKPTKPPTRMTPFCCYPLDEDHLWLVPDRNSESIALISSNQNELKQVGYYALGKDDQSGEGLGSVARTGHGLPSALCIANRKRKQLIFARIHRGKSAIAMRQTSTRGTPSLRSR